MKTLKGLLITVLALGMSTSFAALSADEQVFNNQYDTRLTHSVYNGLKSKSKITEESAERELMSQYCITKNLKDYKKNLDDLLKKNLDGMFDPDKIKKVKITSGVVGVTGAAAGVSVFFLKSFGKIFRASVGTLGVLTALSGAGATWWADTMEEYLYDTSDLELKKSLNTFCNLTDSLEKQ